MFHRKTANATRVLLCNSNQCKFENMKNKPNNTHIPYEANLYVSYEGGGA